MNTEPMSIPEIELEYVIGGLAEPPKDTTRPPSLGGSLGGYASGSGDEGTKPAAGK